MAKILYKLHEKHGFSEKTGKLAVRLGVHGEEWLMKFEFIESNSSNVGRVMSKGVNGNIVFFWDENEDAAEYVLELYRCPLSIKAATFVLPSKVCEFCK